MTFKQRLSRSNIYMFLIPLLIAAALLLVGAGIALYVLETVYLPKVQGVAVLCEGGGDVRVAARITELVRALLDLSANRICVEQRKG